MQPQPTASLDPTGSLPTDVTVSPAEETTPPNLSASVERYVLHDEIARGGMGVVYRATDTTLDREVAVKVLRERLDSAGPARRFLDEARIAGQLQHPGIPSVHDLGTLPDGRPFLAMKLVKGRTLAALLKERTSPDDERGRFVAVFEAICQALGYAHAQGVIHRDLKPANVMVGAFGEVQVMDWGLAKVLASGGRQAPVEQLTVGTEIRTQRDGVETQAGCVLGTPAFMPPEQASGAVERIDVRSDVFGLGAILLVILTGRPPFVGGAAGSTLRLAAQARLDEAFVALDACAAELELVALCKRCLSPEPGDRPADAGAVARAVAELRAAADERAQQAELARVRAEAEAREQRKRRRVQLALAAAIGLLLLGGGATAWWAQAQASERAGERRGAETANRQAAASALDLAEAALRKDDPLDGEIDAALDQAGRRVAAGGADDLRPRLEAAHAARQLLRELDRIADQRWSVAEGKRYLDHEGARDAYRAALRGYGLDLAIRTPEELGEVVRRSLIAARIQEALHDWLGIGGDPELVDLLAALDPDPERTAFRQAVTSREKAVLMSRVGGLDGRAVPASFAMLVGGEALVPEGDRLRILRQAQAAHPSHFGLVMALEYALPRPAADERVASLRIAVAIRRGNPVARYNLAVALRDKGDRDGAIAQYQEAIRLDPKHARAHYNLGVEFGAKGDRDGAIAQYQEAIRLDPKLVHAHTNLGAALRAKGDLDGAIAQYRAALRHAPEFVPARYNLGGALGAKGDRDGAIEQYREILRHAPEFAPAHLNLGVELGGKGDLAGAVGAFKEALRLDPDDARARNNLRRAERLRELSSRLPDIVAGKEEPKNPAEGCEFAALCAQPYQQRYATAVRLYAEAFAADGKLAGDRSASAARAAARAARGDGVDAPAEPTERAGLRAKALAWLRADLETLKGRGGSREAADRQSAASTLARWMVDPDLAGVRPGPRRIEMPAAERAEWDKLWLEVLFTRAAAAKTP